MESVYVVRELSVRKETESAYHQYLSIKPSCWAITKKKKKNTELNCIVAIKNCSFVLTVKATYEQYIF